MKKLALALLLSVAVAPIVAYTEDSADVLNDNQIAEIMKTANMAEIDAAKVAKSKASTEQVKAFAEHMIVEHKQNDKDAKDLAKKESIKPKFNTIAKGIKEDARTEMADLKKLKGTDFDKGYMKMQIAMHQELLNDLDQKFIPAAKNAQFKEFLQTTRTHVAAHLAKAQDVQIDISK